MPAPKGQFSRPSIDLGGDRREWRTVLSTKLSEGDMLPDFGVIKIKVLNLQDIKASPAVTILPHVALENVNGKTMFLELDEMVFAFTHAQ